jgi:hypothetical protein
MENSETSMSISASRVVPEASASQRYPVETWTGARNRTLIVVL